MLSSLNAILKRDSHHWCKFECFLWSANSFSEDLNYMNGSRPNIFWKACWLVISPLMLLVVFGAYVILQAQKHPSYTAWNPEYVSNSTVQLSIM